jgi:hypothetical protein
MADLFFVVKTFLFTLALIVLMQIKIGEYTVEERTHTWIQESAIHSTLTKVAVGAVTAMKDGVLYVREWMADDSSSTQKANR